MPRTRFTAHERRRFRRLLGGLVLCGVGLASMVASDLGLGPWEVLHQGLSFVTGIPIGMMTIIVGVLVLLAWLPLGERPGIGTVLNVVVIGVVIDLTLLVLDTPDSLVLRSLLMAAGPVLFGIGSGYYLGARLGSGPRDGIMMGLARLGIPVGVARATIEILVLVGGWLLGGTVGVGTVLFALGIGPLVHYFLPRLTVADEPVADGRVAGAEVLGDAADGGHGDDPAGRAAPTPASAPVNRRRRRNRVRPPRRTAPGPGASGTDRDTPGR